jgi:hypothetical protein
MVLHPTLNPIFMKTKYTLLTALLISSLCANGQHPLVGTWEMISIKGTDYDGKPFFADKTRMREIKIITPTHYMLIAQDVKGDSLVFNRSHAGTVRFEGNQYIECQRIASWDSLKPVDLAFNWKVEGDKFIQSGTLTRADGKTARLEELVFQRVTPPSSYPKNPSIGTWDQLSSSFTLPDGKKGMHTRETATRFQIITPTHMMRMSHRGNKFESATAESYTMKGNRIHSMLETASFAFSRDYQAELIHRVEANKLYASGKVVFADGKTLTWDDVFEKVVADPVR